MHKLVQIKSISRWILKHLISDKVVYCNEIHIVRHLPTFSMESAIVKNVVPGKKKTLKRDSAVKSLNFARQVFVFIYEP